MVGVRFVGIGDLECLGGLQFCQTKSGVAAPPLSSSMRGVRACLAWLQLHLELLHSKTLTGAGSEWSWSC
jgi:hypothetical protein